MKKQKKEFYAAAFYEQPDNTVYVLNKLLKVRQTNTMEMYRDGKVLFADAYDSADARKILSEIIADFESYKLHNNDQYVPSKSDRIGLCALMQDCMDYFGGEILYSRLYNRFFMLSDETKYLLGEE